MNRIWNKDCWYYLYYNRLVFLAEQPLWTTIMEVDQMNSNRLLDYLILK